MTSIMWGGLCGGSPEHATNALPCDAWSEQRRSTCEHVQIRANARMRAYFGPCTVRGNTIDSATLQTAIQTQFALHWQNYCNGTSAPSLPSKAPPTLRTIAWCAVAPGSRSGCCVSATLRLEDTELSAASDAGKALSPAGLCFQMCRHKKPLHSEPPDPSIMRLAQSPKCSQYRIESVAVHPRAPEVSVALDLYIWSAGSGLE